MKHSFLLAILVLLSVILTTSARAQEARSPAEKCTIAGTVMDAVSEQPLKGAEVRLRGTAVAFAPPAHSSSGSAPPSMSANTDASGRFVFENLPAGRYFVLASHAGYVNSNRAYAQVRGKLLVLTPGQHINDLMIRLLPNGSIAGRITDETGKPLRDVSVEAMTFSYSHGRSELHGAASAPSNAAGEYRIQALSPGKYFIRAKPPAFLKPNPASDKAYIPIYYPAANDQARAIALVLRAGEDLTAIDLNLVPVHTFRIRGRVLNARTSSPSKAAEVTLLSEQGETVFSPSKNFSAGGQANYEFQGVPSGSYVVVAQEPSTVKEPKTIWGRTSVDVEDASIEHADVMVSEGADVSGRIRMEGKNAGEIGKDLSTLVGVLQSQEPSSLAGLTPDIDYASVKPDGTFIFQDVPEGSYRVEFHPVPPGFYLESSGAVDVLETGLTVSRGHSPAALELLLSSGAGRIDGTLENNQQPVPGGLVGLVPEGRERQPNYYQVCATDLLGRFGLRNIIPGDYTLFAWEQIDRDAYLDPEFIARYQDRGKAIHVGEGDQLNIKLDAIPATETAP